MLHLQQCGKCFVSHAATANKNKNSSTADLGKVKSSAFSEQMGNTSHAIRLATMDLNYLKKRSILHLSRKRNLGCLTWVRLQQLPAQRFPSLSVCAVFSCVQTMLWLPESGICNMHTGADACDCAQGLWESLRRKLTLGKTSLVTRGNQTHIIFAPVFSVQRSHYQKLSWSFLYKLWKVLCHAGYVVQSTVHHNKLQLSGNVCKCLMCHLKCLTCIMHPQMCRCILGRRMHACVS